MIGPGRRCGDIRRSIIDAILPFHPHPVTKQAQGNAIGLALAEPPLITMDSADTFEIDGVYTLRVGISDERNHAIVSAMLAVNTYGCEVLWSTPVSDGR
jgi:hypothetical protein